MIIITRGGGIRQQITTVINKRVSRVICVYGHKNCTPNR